MSQAPVGHRSADRLQWTQRSSSFTITLPGLIPDGEDANGEEGETEDRSA